MYSNEIAAYLSEYLFPSRASANAALVTNLSWISTLQRSDFVLKGFFTFNFLSVKSSFFSSVSHCLYWWFNKESFMSMPVLKSTVCVCVCMLFDVTFLHMVWDWVGEQEVSPAHAISLSC